MIYSLKNNKNAYFIFQNTSDLKILNSFLNFELNNNFVLVQGSGVEINYYYEIFNNKPSPNKKRFVYASRLIKEKGIMNFIEGAIKFNEKFCINKQDFEFLIVGKFINDELKWKIKKNFIKYIDHIDENIVYLDHQDSMKTIFEIASVIVLPTYYGEGVPKVLIESLASGVPIITTFQRGCRELVNNGKNGFVCRKKDSENLSLIFNQFSKLSKDELNQMSQNCISYAKDNLSIDKVNEKHIIAYKYFE